MCGDEQTDSGLVTDIAQKACDIASGERIKVAGWLIGDDEAWAMDERTRQGDTLLFATG